MNSWWEWSMLNWIIPFWIISLTKQSLKRRARFRMGAQEEKDKKEIPPPLHGWRRDGAWSVLCGCRLCSLSRVGKERLAQSCPLLLFFPMLPSEQHGRSQVSVLGLCTTGTQLAPWPTVHQHFCAKKSRCLVPPKLERRVWAPRCMSAANSLSSFPCQQS